MAARAAAQEQPALARRFLSDVLAVSEGNHLLWLTYQSRHLLGQLAYAEGALPVAEAEYRAAIEVLERLSGQVMTEFRADFLEDKQDVYGDMVGLLLDDGKLAQAFTYVERAKSRALLDLLAYQLDLSLHPKVASDAPLVADLVRLQAARNQLLRRWQSQYRQAWQEGQPVPVSKQRQIKRLQALEEQITEGWHQLLIRNADYARQATLWQPRAQSVQPYLPLGTALLEYFPVREKLCAFVVTPDSIQVCFLPATLSQIRRAFKKLQKLNLNKVPRSRPARVARLALNAQGLLKQLYDWLIAPLHKQLAAYPRLLIVPHDTLHYLPFHALYDGASFLIESHEISYLPSASLLRYCQEVPPAAGKCVLLGYSNQNHLPHAVSEARTIAGLLEGELLLEEEATVARLQEIAPQCSLLHLATHGEFREDNPLFSGLTLADGSLTTLDIFNLRLRASLVTLSACQTGKHKIGGGDELLGLTRAFLYAGAASLLLSHWKVADRATAQFMQTFYQQLANGATNSAALRYTQLQFLRPDKTRSGSHAAKPYAHPYFWASFFLIGDTRTIQQS
jgi:CHAT domain-containing protein